jgi:predicted MFS family arabinose efflux permease
MKASERFGMKRVVTAALAIVTAALLLLAHTSTSSGYGHIALVLGLLGFGMGATMAPATNSVMAALPKTKAGVGSAINDTVRQVGGALGVAVLGSLLSSGYAARLGDVIHGTPVPAAAKEGIGPALAVASHLPNRAGTALIDTARRAFVHGMDLTVLVGAGITLVAVIAAWLWMPHDVEAATDADLSAELERLTEDDAVIAG